MNTKSGSRSALYRKYTLSLIMMLALAALPATLASAADTGWRAPTASTAGGGSGGWTNAANGYASDDNRATASSTGSWVNYATFNIPAIPAGSTIQGIEVSLEASTGGRQVRVSLSSDNGTTFTTNVTSTTGALEGITTVGGAANTWGRTWAAGEFTNANFIVRLQANNVAGTYSLDQVMVRVYYIQPTTLTVSTASGTYGGTASLSATLTVTTGGAAVAGKPINFTLNGVSVVGNPYTTNASGVATVPAASLAGINAGTYPTGVGASFAGDADYVASSGTSSLTVNKANATIVVTPYSVTYDGSPHTATGTAKGVLDEDLSGLDLGETTHTNAGIYDDSWTFTDVTGNYNDDAGAVADEIDKADALISVRGYTFAYDGSPHTATGTATGVLAEPLSGLDLSGTTHTAVGVYPTDPWTFTDVTGNYNDDSGAVDDEIFDGTPPILTITGATDNGDDMAGDLSTGYILETTNFPLINHLIQFKSGTGADEPLADDYFGLKLIESTVSPAEIKAYYAARGVPEPYLSYLNDAADGINPFVYIKGTTVTLVDAAKHDLDAVDVDMTVPDDFPLGTYTVQGDIEDLAGNPTTVTLKLIVAEATFTISGNAGVAGATLAYADGTPKTATADGSGNYSFEVSANWSGTVTPWMPGYTFSPEYRTYTNVLSDQTGQNYTATAIHLLYLPVVLR